MAYKQIIIGFDESQRADAESICEMLENEGVTVFMAESTLVDAMSDGTLSDNVENCTALILLLSNSTQKLGSVSKQLLCALNLQKLIIPIKLEDFVLDSDIAPYLSNVQQIFAYKNKAEEITAVVKQLKDMVYFRDDESRYSLTSFFGGLLRVKARNVKKKADKKAKEIKYRIAEIPFGRIVSTILHTVTVIATAAFIYAGVSSSWRLTRGEVRLIAGVPFGVGAVIALVSSFLIGKIKNKIAASVISVIVSAVIFVVMMLTGFTISQSIQ